MFVGYVILSYRYWWHTRIFSFTKKSYLYRAHWRYYSYLSRVRMDNGVTMVTNINFDSFWNRKYKYYCLYLSFITLYASLITFLWQVFCDRWPLYMHYFAVSKINKKSFVLYRNFISIYKINITFHGRLGIRMLSSRAEREILSALEDKIRIPEPPFNILYIYAWRLYDSYKWKLKLKALLVVLQNVTLLQEEI